MIRVDHEAAGTRVLVELSYNPVAGAVGHALATLLGADPRHKLADSLQRLKSYIETWNQPADASAADLRQSTESQAVSAPVTCARWRGAPQRIGLSPVTATRAPEI